MHSASAGVHSSVVYFCMAMPKAHMGNVTVVEPVSAAYTIMGWNRKRFERAALACQYTCGMSKSPRSAGFSMLACPPVATTARHTSME